MKKELINRDKETLARELLQWRLRAGLTQRQAAERMNVSRYTIIRAEGMKFIGLAMAYRISASLAKALRDEGLEYNHLI